MCLINVIKMYRNSFTSWIGRNFLFSWDFFLLSLLPPTFVSHRVCVKEMILFSSLFSRNLKQRKKQISIRKTDPGGKQTRKNRKKKWSHFCTEDARRTFFKSTTNFLTSNLYQIVPKRGAKQQDRTQPQYQLLGTGCTVLLPLWGSQWGLGQADHNTDDLDTLCEPARRIYAKKMCVHACMHIWPHMWGRGKWRSNVVTSLSCQVLCQRSCNRARSVGIRNERFMYTITFFSNFFYSPKCQTSQPPSGHFCMSPLVFIFSCIIISCVHNGIVLISPVFP